MAVNINDGSTPARQNMLCSYCYSHSIAHCTLELLGPLEGQLYCEVLVPGVDDSMEIYPTPAQNVQPMPAGVHTTEQQRMACMVPSQSQTIPPGMLTPTGIASPLQL